MMESISKEQTNLLNTQMANCCMSCSILNFVTCILYKPQALVVPTKESIKMAPFRCIQSLFILECGLVGGLMTLF